MEKLIRYFTFRILGRNRTRNWILRMFKIVEYDPLEVAHYSMGINRYWDISDAGEDNFLGKVLTALLSPFAQKELMMLDVGANKGNYCVALNQHFPQASIIAFEPSPAAFNTLLTKTESFSQFSAENSAVGKERSKLQFFTYEDDPESELASIIPGVVNEQQGRKVISYNVDVLNLDDYCNEKNIDVIHFLKIDTEGYELEVLKGARSLIQQGKIKVIQFEFNGMNVNSRVFLKDFYDILDEYNFFRMMVDGLLYLGNYAHRNEIFYYQNIIAIRKEFTPAHLIAKKG